MKKLLTIALMIISVQMFAQSQFQNESAGNLVYTSGQVMQLAEAIPADNYSWTPEEGVRSVSGVLTHIVSANYFFGSMLGGTVPEGVNLQTIEQDLTEKEEIAAALKSSYDVLIGAIKNLDDAKLGDKVTTPFGEFTVMGLSLIGLGHAHEHLGQLIAYARNNGVTPPWSKGSGE